MTLLLAVVLFAVAITLLANAFAHDETPRGVSRTLASLEQLTAHGTNPPAEEEPGFADRVVAPLQARAVVLGRRISGADKNDRIRHRLDLAGNPLDWSVDRVIGLKVMAGAVVPVCGVVYARLIGLGLATSALLVLVCGLVGYFGPDLYLRNRADHRNEEIRRTLADAVDLLTISVEAGLGFDGALQHVARNTEGPLGEEFSRVLREVQLGRGRSDALKALALRTTVDDLKSFVGAMVQAETYGVSITQVLRVQSAEIRTKRRQHAEAKAQQVPVKIMFPLVLCILPCLFVVVLGPAALRMMTSF